MSASKVIRFAILGTAGHASRVAVPALQSVPGVELLGGVGSRPERSATFAEQFKLPRTYANIDAVLGDREVDAVWICSPNYLHGEQVEQCAAAGKHILAEKPLAVGGEAAKRAVAAVAKAGVTLQIDCQHRFRPAHIRIRELIQSGTIGTVGYVRVHRFWPYPYYPGMDAAGPAEWRRSAKQSGGWVINDIGSHLIDLALWFTGMPAEVAGAVLASQKFDFGTEDSCSVLLKMGASTIGAIECSNASVSPGSRIEFYGSDGWLRADDTLSGASVITRNGGEPESFPAFTAAETYTASVSDFIKAINGQAHIGADGAAGIAVAAITEAALVRGVVATSHGSKL